jgi:acetyl-CoA synthetase
VADAAGYLQFVSRKDDLIISAGYRVDPLQIERALMTHPEVALAAVVGEPDDIRGQVPVAFVTLAPNHRPAADELVGELLASLSGKVPGYARPQRVTVLDQLPLTSTGKLARSRLRGGPDGARP